MSIDGVSASCVLSTRGTSPPGSRLHVFCTMRAFADDELSAGTSEEEHNVWKKGVGSLSVFFCWAVFLGPRYRHGIGEVGTFSVTWRLTSVNASVHADVANGVTQHEIWRTRLGAEWTMLFLWPVQVPNRRGWVNEWSSESVDRDSVWKDLHAMSKRMMEAMHQKYVDVSESDKKSLNQSRESEQADFREMRVELSSSDSNTMCAEEDGR